MGSIAESRTLCRSASTSTFSATSWWTRCRRKYGPEARVLFYSMAGVYVLLTVLGIVMLDNGMSQSTRSARPNLTQDQHTYIVDAGPSR